MLIALLALAAAGPALLYGAWGTEPFWGLTITRKSMILDDQSAEKKTEVPTPKPVITRLGMTYSTPKMTVVIRHEGCNDGMSERVEADTVEVRLDGQRAFSGCGGPEVKPRHIAGSSWDIYSLNGETIPYVPQDDPRARSDLFAIHWQLNRTVHANLGCGELIGRYKAGGGRIAPTERMRALGGKCEYREFERGALAILAASAPVRWLENGEEIELKNKAGTLHLRRRY